ncbi:deaminase [Phenylobacterium sp. Root77]|uniref:RibD family protein n=1 Tax=unclassified Phenylobacterium TaxID=2640670 RepID=UPI0006FE0C12|nr:MULTISPECIES: RibD family protein [unclassified Phenylobacterium]KQW71638.1 deaminase [Phenylobacterium sp. Root1277]KQW94558.1 deaminase [Phenylobacterium sp. Root1290]KRC44883.1 deaminase [Phenylobacterium sp. Root77]
MGASVTLKLATSLDGRIATATGESRWITGPQAREVVHRLRAEHDAVLVGVETALADDPELNVRLDGWNGPQPARVVLDSRQRLADGCKLVATARDIPTYVITAAAPEHRLLDAGVRVLQVHAVGDARPELRDVVETLAREGLRRLFVEGGGQVAGSFLRCGLVDRIEWFRAPMVIGGEGRPGIGALALSALGEAPRLRRIEIREVGDDLWERYERI